MDTLLDTLDPVIAEALWTALMAFAAPAVAAAAWVMRTVFKRKNARKALRGMLLEGVDMVTDKMAGDLEAKNNRIGSGVPDVIVDEIVDFVRTADIDWKQIPDVDATKLWRQAKGVAATRFVELKTLFQ